MRLKFFRRTAFIPPPADSSILPRVVLALDWASDMVSRGGNFQFDIGPSVDGTIPAIMQQRLHEVGYWLRVNGEAIYATCSAKGSHQWSAGEQPKINYNAKSDTLCSVGRCEGWGAETKSGLRALLLTAKLE